jgi:hypothetical protein
MDARESHIIVRTLTVRGMIVAVSLCLIIPASVVPYKMYCAAFGLLEQLDQLQNPNPETLPPGFLLQKQSFNLLSG